MNRKDELKKRAHDKVPELNDWLKKLSRKKKEDRYKILVGLKDIIITYDKSIFDEHVGEFSYQKRWYDKDPFSWMIMNSLKYADKKLLIQVKSFLKKELEPEGKKK